MSGAQRPAIISFAELVLCPRFTVAVLNAVHSGFAQCNAFRFDSAVKGVFFLLTFCQFNVC